MRDSRPIVVGFLCTWCAYRAADLVGTARRPYAENLRPVRVVCTGRVGPELVLKAFAAGAEGVLVVGCHPGECHRVDGNLKALKRLALLRQTLACVGVEPERLRLVWAGAAEGVALADAADQIVDTVRQLGPLHQRAGVHAALWRGDVGEEESAG